MEMVPVPVASKLKRRAQNGENGAFPVRLLMRGVLHPQGAAVVGAVFPVPGKATHEQPDFRAGADAV